MSERPLSQRFFEAWIETCEERLPELLLHWDSCPFYTATILKDANSIIKVVAKKLEFECYCDYYAIDAVLYKREDLVPEIPTSLTWLRRVRIGFEHENDFDSGLFQEVSHLLITDCDLRVLVSYAGEASCRDGELECLHRLIRGSDRSARVAESASFLFIIGNRDPQKTKAIWTGYFYQESGWKRVDWPT